MDSRRCIAPTGDVPDGADLESVRLCGAPATTTRLSEGLECPLCAAHATEIDDDRADLTPWRSLDLTRADARGCYAIAPDSAEGLRVLREYRDTASMDGVFLATEDELDDDERTGADSAARGPSVAEIDWTGFDAAAEAQS